MCRNIRKLRQAERLPTEQEMEEAALQFVRKVSGFRKPSRINEEAFDFAVTEVTDATRRLFDNLKTR